MEREEAEKGASTKTLGVHFTQQGSWRRRVVTDIAPQKSIKPGAKHLCPKNRPANKKEDSSNGWFTQHLPQHLHA